MLRSGTQIAELQQFLDELESVAPLRAGKETTTVTYRQVAVDELVNDSLDSDEGDEETEYYSSRGLVDETPDVFRFHSSKRGPLVAVDCGIARLGETEDGIVIALRATILIVQDNSESRAVLFRSGPLYLKNEYRLQALHQIGKHLGKPDFFVDLDLTSPENPKPIRIKSYAQVWDAHQYGDRFRNWFERLAQQIAVTAIEDGVVLFDGALTMRTRDTPGQYLEYLAQLAHGKNNALVAISKQSKLLIANKSVRFWLNDKPNEPCYRLLTPMLRRLDKARAQRVLGNIYASRFSPLGPTFRMDVKAVDGQSDDEAICKLYGSALMRSGYPDVLVRAHTHSYFTYPDIIQLQAQSGVKFKLAPQPEVQLTSIFAPFGGEFK